MDADAMYKKLDAALNDGSELKIFAGEHSRKDGLIYFSAGLAFPSAAKSNEVRMYELIFQERTLLESLESVATMYPNRDYHQLFVYSGNMAFLNKPNASPTDALEQMLVDFVDADRYDYAKAQIDPGYSQKQNVREVYVRRKNKSVIMELYDIESTYSGTGIALMVGKRVNNLLMTAKGASFKEAYDALCKELPPLRQAV